MKVDAFREDLWTSKNGKTHQIKDMDLNHIKNCIALLERRGKTLIPIYRSLCKERDYREALTSPIQTRFKLMVFHD